MKKYKNWIIIANLLIIIAYFSFTIVQKEKILKDGQVILLQLAPVDPRSLMQGDYMTLRYALAQKFTLNDVSRRGYLVVKLNRSGVAEALRIQSNMTPLNKEEIVIKYTMPNKYTLLIGAESYFFQEGEAAKYDKAKFGGIQVDDKGNSLLIGLYDENRKMIK
ncbi:GDYXXLXY domain-containing protein [Sphingobacterium sp. SRCM116780]|uniref:GDYXXLXY domain-containing protein n=1 Tax=Sphingobacterium sp. SRCM116780 TaxID=2907623 RepID=UPI001F23CF65|nr:GDYXXLXY domain-containing protein [Sphingobacterium sp. SRCM116780]UIR55038.1 GDYXXLXY domain-containing protein [Sphingobacterium sp. SRCM116780]